MPSSAVSVDPTPDSLFSADALRRAWQEVRRNGQSPGIDKVSMADFGRRLDAELTRLRQEVLTGTYRPQKALRFYKIKPSGKKRPLTVWAVRDRVLQRVVHDYLTGVCEPIFLDCSYGFRPNRRVEDACAHVQRGLADHLRWIVDADIQDCFDSIPPDRMMAQAQQVIHVPLIVHLIHLWLHTPIIGQPGVLTGVSQGGVLSPQLTNLYLHRFDQVITARLPHAQLIRFADDFVILCRRKVEAQQALTVARDALAKLRLHLNPTKTRVLHADEGFTFLGVSFQGAGLCPSSTSKIRAQ